MSTSGRDESDDRPHASQVAGSLEQVREILFGPHQRDLARRLSRTDAHVAAQAEALRNETRFRLDLLETYMRKELEVLTTLVAGQEKAQKEALDRTAMGMRENLAVLEQRVKKLEDTVARVDREVREQLLGQAKLLSDEVQRARSELTAVVEREVRVVWGEPAEPTEKAEHEPESKTLEAATGWQRPGEAA